jgi:hypothetical protein
MRWTQLRTYLLSPDPSPPRPSGDLSLVAGTGLLGLPLEDLLRRPAGGEADRRFGAVLLARRSESEAAALSLSEDDSDEYRLRRVLGGGEDDLDDVEDSESLSLSEGVTALRVSYRSRNETRPVLGSPSQPCNRFSHAKGRLRDEPDVSNSGKQQKNTQPPESYLQLTSSSLCFFCPASP